MTTPRDAFVEFLNATTGGTAGSGVTPWRMPGDQDGHNAKAAEQTFIDTLTGQTPTTETVPSEQSPRLTNHVAREGNSPARRTQVSGRSLFASLMTQGDPNRTPGGWTSLAAQTFDY